MVVSRRCLRGKLFTSSSWNNKASLGEEDSSFSFVCLFVLFFCLFVCFLQIRNIWFSKWRWFFSSLNQCYGIIIVLPKCVYWLVLNCFSGEQCGPCMGLKYFWNHTSFACKVFHCIILIWLNLMDTTCTREKVNMVSAYLHSMCFFVHYLVSLILNIDYHCRHNCHVLFFFCRTLLVLPRSTIKALYRYVRGGGIPSPIYSIRKLHAIIGVKINHKRFYNYLPFYITCT